MRWLFPRTHLAALFLEKPLRGFYLSPFRILTQAFYTAALPRLAFLEIYFVFKVEEICSYLLRK